jgi:small subunit ribosomal protein S8e
MARSQARSNRKTSGGRYHPSRTKRSSELVGFPAMTKIAETKIKTQRIIGGNVKKSVLGVKEVSVADKKGKSVKTEVVNVLENPANPNLVRRNIVTKGAIVETKLGKARITSRPGQEGCVCAVLI